MKKLQTLLLVLFAIQAMAGPLSPQVAKKNAQTFLKSSQNIPHAPGLRMAYRCERPDAPDQSYYYIFNVGDNDGFVIMSGEENTSEVLGYCDHGDFDVQRIPDNLKWWLQYYEESLKWAAEHQTTKQEADPSPTDVILPLIKTQWDQAWPYNDRCPEYHGSKCPTGCVATALAQLLYYHQYPVEQTEEIPGYQCRSLDKWMPGLPAIAFNWDDMKYTYNRYSSQASIDAVALLMQYCGQLVEMGYSPDGSGAQTDIIAERLPQYLGYPQTIHSVSRMGYSVAEWDSLLLNELRNNRPVLYTGYTSAMEGHAFICDGYDGKGLFHINWGWGGVADGDYRISVLDARGNGIGGSSTSMRFTFLQSALFGVKTEGEDDFVKIPQRLAISGRPSLRDGREYQRNAKTRNFSNIAVSYDLFSTSESGWYDQINHGLNLYDDQGTMVKNVARKNDHFWPQYPGEVEFENLSFGKDIDDGHYTLRPVYSDGSQWIEMAGAGQNYIDVQIEGDKMTLTPVPKADFVVSSIERAGRSVVVTLTNNDEEYNGPLLLCKLNKKGDYEMVAYEYVAILPGETRTFSVYVPEDASVDLQNDVFFLSVDNYPDQYFYSNVSNADADIVKEIYVENLTEDGSKAVGDKVMTHISVENQGTGEYRHFIVVSLCNEEGMNVSDEFRRVVDIQPGERMMFNIDFPIRDYSSNVTVRASHIEGKNTSMPLYTDTFALEKGALYWNAEGNMKMLPYENVFVVPEEALAINLRAAYKADVQPNSNPNTIYMLDKNVPKSLKGRNIVNYENKSGNIVINDAYDFYLPVAVTATNSVKYTRKFSVDEWGKWSTLVVPFKPESIKVDGSELNWIKGVDDTAQTFWLQSLSGVSQNQALLQNADQVEACTPYFISIAGDLVGKTVEFSAAQTVLQPEEVNNPAQKVADYTFAGTNVLVNKPGIHALDGQCLVYSENTQSVAPFRAYLLRDQGVTAADRILLQGPDIADGILSIPADALSQPADVYNLSGVKVADTSSFQSLPKGVYIVNGQKLFIK